DEHAARSANALSADAFTSGRDIYFAQGKYSPGSEQGQHLIAHELTHTVQQKGAVSQPSASPTGGVLVGDAADPLELEAEHTADRVMGLGASTPPVSKDSTPPVRRNFASGAAGVWNATGGAVARGAEALWDEAKETAAAFINRMFPGLLPLLRNASNLLYEKITSGMDAAFNGIASRVRKQGVAGAITGLLGDLAGSIGKSLGNLLTGSCHSMVEAAASIIHFVKGIAGDAFAQLGKIAKEVGEFFSGIWNDYGAPALEAIKKVAGEAWGWITDQAKWIWDKLLPIRKAFSKAWNWIKTEFNIAKEETAGVLDWLYDKAKEQWFKIRDKIAPILGPLKIVAGALLLLSPLGPIILIWKGGPLLWQGLQWIWANGLKPAGEWIKAKFHEHILPYILEGIDGAIARLDEASAFLCQHAGSISSGLHSLQAALAGIPFCSFAARMVGSVAGFFDGLAAKGKCKFSDLIAEVKSVLHKIHQFLKPVLEVFRQAALIVTFGPLAIVDDGVWKTFTSFVALIKKTPCIREIAGLLQMDWVVDKITEIRTHLKDIYEVITHKDKFEAAIRNALGGLLAKIPGQVEAVLGGVVGLDGPHLDALMKRFLAPKLAQTVARAPQLLIDMVWGLVWPWPGVFKQWDEIKTQAEKLKSSLWDFEFSKAIDAGLAIWRGVNGIVGQLYGWFFLAAVLIGAVFGAPEAGAALAYEVGEVLLASTLIAEQLSIEKARLNLMSDARRAEPEKDRQVHDDEDYETISGSLMNLAVMAALAELSEIAVDFAKAIFAEIKGIFKPRGVEAPVEIPGGAIEPPEAGEPVKTGETPQAAEPPEMRPDENVVEERPTADGQHKIEITEEGECLICSDCVSLKKEYAKELADPANSDLKAEIDAAEKITDPAAKAAKEVEIEKKLSDARAESLAEPYEDLPKDEQIKPPRQRGGKQNLDSWLKDEGLSPKEAREFKDWLEKGHDIGEPHEHLRPFSEEAKGRLEEWKQETGRAGATEAPEGTEVPADESLKGEPGEGTEVSTTKTTEAATAEEQPAPTPKEKPAPTTETEPPEANKPPAEAKATEQKPDQQQAEKTAKETEEPAEAPEETNRKERVRKDIEDKLDKIQEEKATNQAELDRVRKELDTANEQIRNLKDKVRNSTGKARAEAVDELKAAQEARAELVDELNAHIDDKVKLNKTEEALQNALREDTYSRPSLKKSTKQAIQDAAKKTPDGKFIDPNTGKVIEGDFDYGHKPGHEQRRLAIEAQSKGMTRQQYIDWVNDHPEWFQIEEHESNISHKFEKPGID
ncbi:MAG TPA: DUF4157 domain-containing protein, partial [Terriglobales bacterium]